MGYTPFDNRVLPIMVVYIIMIISFSFLTYKLLKKYSERKHPAALHLALVDIFITIAILILAIGLLEAIITGYYMEIYRLSLPLAYSMIIIANIFLYFFASEITEKWESALIPIIIIGIALIIMVFLPWNWWGYPREDYEGKFNIRLYTNIAFISFSYFIYIMNAYICQKTKAKSGDKVARVGLSLLFYAMISMMLFFLMVLFDNLLIAFYNHPGYSEFQFIAWIFGFVFVILTYFSLIMPKWLMKRITKE